MTSALRIQMMMEDYQRAVDAEDEQELLHWRDELAKEGIKTGRLHRKSDGTWWVFPKLTAEEVREQLLAKVQHTDEDLADPVVHAELWKTIGRVVDREPHHIEYDLMSMDTDRLRVVIDTQRQLRKIKPIYQPVTDAELEELKATYDASSPGPYTLCHGGECSCGLVWSHSWNVPVHAPASAEEGDVPDREHQKADARFVAAAHNLMPRLIETIVRLRKQESLTPS